MVNPKRKESDILSSCLRLLKARGIFAIRMNTGAFQGEYKGRKRFVKFGVPGCADILVMQGRITEGFYPIWVETKAEGKNQSPMQKEFAKLVTAYGMRYVVVHSADELNLVL